MFSQLYSGCESSTRGPVRVQGLLISDYIQPLNAINSVVAGGDEITLTVLLQHRAVNLPEVSRWAVDTAFIRPSASRRVSGRIFQYPGTLLAEIRTSRPSRVVDIPLTVQKIQLRCPQVAGGRALGWRCPDDTPTRRVQVRHFCRFPESQVVVRGVQVVVKTVFLVHPRVGPGRQQRVLKRSGRGSRNNECGHKRCRFLFAASRGHQE